ncbi:MAG: type II secretion system F family protein [Clostridiales bacterium]|nr:type II secretion system F family protein [Clostridiales bacterium]
MPLYKYTAKDVEGRTVRGLQDAADSGDLLKTLRDMGLFLLTFDIEEEKKTGGLRMRGKDLADFNRQLGAMLSSGITLLRAIEIVMRRDMKKQQRSIYEKLYASLLMGVPMSDAMEAQGKVFPPLLINMYRSGEASGTLDVTAARMAEHYDKEYQLQGKVKSAMSYPLVLLVLTVAVVIILFTFVLPSFEGILSQVENLPGITRFVMGISDTITAYWPWLLIGLIVLIAAVQGILNMPPVRLRFDRFKLKMPVFGPLLRIIVTARFSRTLASLYASGLSILTALHIARGTVGNAYISWQFEKLIDDVRTGSSLADALERVDGFDKKLSATVGVGEESGRLEPMLISVADSFDYEANEASGRMVNVLQPIMIIVMAVVVGSVIFSVIGPLLNMYGEIGANSPTM